MVVCYRFGRVDEVCYDVVVVVYHVVLIVVIVVICVCCEDCDNCGDLFMPRKFMVVCR